ncbi:MAG: diaminopimelate epimerase [Actinobacteria bacterium]|nr:diaminopimelate epimerase [Actinomycetota bacterium]
MKFLKMHGQGNDFILIDSLENNVNISAGEISRMCDRHFGIGADGLILVKRSQRADFFMDYYNQDGSTAEMCGNGIRCMAGFILINSLWDKQDMIIETRAGMKKIKINLEADLKERNKRAIRGFHPDVKIMVDMGRPIFEPAKIPVTIPEQVKTDNKFTRANYGTKDLKYHGLIVMDNILSISEKDFYINCLSMGNPHCVVFLDEKDDLKQIPVSTWGPAIETHRIFPNKTNVEFVKIKNSSEIEMRVWERGVGETLACGTGACAAAVCAIERKKIDSAKVCVHLPGGNLNIYWKQQSSPVLLEGSVDAVYSGIFLLK